MSDRIIEGGFDARVTNREKYMLDLCRQHVEDRITRHPADSLVVRINGIELPRVPAEQQVLNGAATDRTLALGRPNHGNRAGPK
jgi:hypothetical protein